MNQQIPTIDNKTKLSTNKKIKKWCNIKFRNKTIDTHDQIFKIVLTGIFLGLSVGASVVEMFSLEKIPPIMGADLDLRLFNVFILIFSIPIIGVWYSVLIGIIEPWLHFAFHSEHHSPYQMLFSNIVNILVVLSFFFIFYKLFNINNSSGKNCLIKKTLAGAILIPFCAFIATIGFILTILVINTISLEKKEYEKTIQVFFNKGLILSLIFFSIEFARFTLIYILFSLIQKKLTKIRFNHKH